MWPAWGSFRALLRSYAHSNDAESPERKLKWTKVAFLSASVLSRRIDPSEDGCCVDEAGVMRLLEKEIRKFEIRMAKRCSRFTESHDLEFERLSDSLSL